MKGYLLFLFLVGALQLPAQSFEYVYRNPADRSYNCYLKVVPATQEIRGLVIRDYSSLPDTGRQSPFKFMSLCTENGFMTVYSVTSRFYPELYYDDASARILDEMIHEVLSEYDISSENIFIGGISASGTRALRYAQYCAEGKSKYNYRIRGVFTVDSPLDLERFYRSAQRIKDRNVSNSMLDEAELMLKVLPEQLGGTPDEFPEKYRQASVYSFSDPQGGNAIYYRDLPMIIYHEPDIEWWMDEKKCTYYDINSFDIAGFVNRVRLLGNKNVELVTTTGKGFDRAGNRKPHSWTIVDEQGLMDWILSQTKP